MLGFELRFKGISCVLYVALVVPAKDDVEANVEGFVLTRRKGIIRIFVTVKPPDGIADRHIALVVFLSDPDLQILDCITDMTNCIEAVVRPDVNRHIHVNVVGFRE